MALLARVIASFQAAIPVPTLNDLDGECNQLVGANGALNGGSTNKRIFTKYSHATEPVYEIDQLGAGPIFHGKQNGTLKTLLTNAGNLTISNTAPEIILSDTDNAKQMRMALNDTVWNFINDTLAANAISIATATNVATFGQIPVGPAADPTTANQFSRKQYIDDKAYWGASWFIADPSTFPLNNFNLSQKVLVPKGNYRVLTLHGIFATGSASGSFSVELRKHPFNSQAAETLLGTITFNTGTLGVGIDVDIADHEFTEKDWLYLILTARSSPLQRDVSISVVGDKLGTI